MPWWTGASRKRHRAETAARGLRHLNERSLGYRKAKRLGVTNPCKTSTSVATRKLALQSKAAREARGLDQAFCLLLMYSMNSGPFALRSSFTR